VLEGQNASWPSAEAVRRTTREMRRVLRKFLAFDTELIMRAFSTDFAELGLKPDLTCRPGSSPRAASNSPRAALGDWLWVLSEKGLTPSRP
jgi:hypothetical protein